jgi:hypothetical protein
MFDWVSLVYLVLSTTCWLPYRLHSNINVAYLGNNTVAIAGHLNIALLINPMSGENLSCNCMPSTKK